MATQERFLTGELQEGARRRREKGREKPRSVALVANLALHTYSSAMLHPVDS
jgi:hypothetical protein